MVSSLISTNGNSWDVDLLNDIFDERDINLIFSVNDVLNYVWFEPYK